MKDFSVATIGTFVSNMYSNEHENMPAKEWNFYVSIDEQKLDDLANGSKGHAFTPEISALQEMMQELYMRKGQISSGDATTTIQIRHPRLYSAVKNIEKYYAKKMKKCALTSDELETLEYVLRVAVRLSASTR